MSEVSIEVGGRRLSGWKSASIARKLGSICGQFSLSLLDSWSPVRKSFYIPPFSACKILIDKETVLTGFVDVVTLRKSQSGTEIRISGRDITGDLVDCAPDLSAYEFKGITLSQLVRKLLAGFSIDYVEGVSPGDAFEFVEINQGASIASVLETYAKYRGLFFITDASGRLVLVSPGSETPAQTALVSGRNIKEYEAAFDTQNRFSVYKVLSQAKGADDFFGESANQIEETATDSGVPRTRTKVTVGDQAAEAKDAKKKAEWMASVNAARGEKLTISVAGWRQGPGAGDPLWKVNSKAYVKLAEAGVNSPYLISGVTYSKDYGGEVAELVLERVDAYLPEPVLDPVESSTEAFFPEAF